MTALLFWIACSLVQKSLCLTSEANEIASVTSQTSEHSSSNYDITDIPPGSHFNEVPSLTTSANDIECSNTEGCVSPRNLFSTSTIPPGINHKVSWRSFTLKRVSTEVTQTYTSANPSSFSQDNPSTSQAQDTTLQTTNDDVGNELDSEVKALLEYFAPRTSTVALTNEFVDPTNASVPETNNNLLFNNSDLPTISTTVSVSKGFAATLTQEHTTDATDTVTNITSTVVSEIDTTKTGDLLTLYPILEHGAKDSTAMPTQDDLFHSISSEVHSIYNDTTYVPFSFSSSESTAIPTKQKYIVDIFHENMSTTTTIKMPDVQTEVIRKLENVTDFSESERILLNVGQPESNVSFESTALTTEYPKELISSNTALQSDSDESKFQTTTMPYTDQGKVENVTTENLMSSEGYLSMYSVNASHKEISEGHGLRRNLSYFLPSTEQPVMKTGTDSLTRLYPPKDISTTTLLQTTSSPYTDEIATPTFALNSTILDDLPTIGISHSDSQFQSTSSILNFSEQVKTISSVTKHEPSMHVPNTSAPPTTLPVVEIGMDDKEMGTTTIARLLPEGRMYEEGISVRSTSEAPTTEKIVSESTPDSSTENETSMLPTTIQQYQTSLVEDTTPMSIEVAETVSYSNSNISTSLSDLQTSQFTTKLIVEISSNSSADHSISLSSTHSYKINKASETTTMIPVKSYPSTTNPPMEESGATKLTFSYSTFTPSLTTKSQIAFVTTQQRMGRTDLESTTHPSFEQTPPVQPTILATTSTMVSPIFTQPDNTSTHETSPTVSSFALTSMSPSFPISTIRTAKATNQQFSTTNLVASDYTTDYTVPTTIFSILTTEQESPRTESVEGATDSSTTLNIPSYSTSSTALPTVKLFTQGETRREGKHIPFSTVATRRETVGLSENGIIRVTSTDPPAENGTKTIYQQMEFDKLMHTEKANVITAAIQFSPKHLDIEEMKAKMVNVHSWLLHVLMKEFQNWTRDPFEETEDESSTAPFGNISIFYITPTPEINSSGITLTFIVYNVWKNETLQVDFVLGILNYYSKELKESINASAAYFYHGYEADEHYLMSAILERYGVVIITIGLAVVLILLLVCVVVFYRKKTRRSVHCLSNSKFKQNMHEAVGIDLNPAIVILQDEKTDKLGNGNKICDDEGWLAPINDMPQAEDSNMPFIQDTKL